MSQGDIQNVSKGLVVCNPPYIRVGVECCLDRNNNSICDRDETGTTSATPTASPEPARLPTASLRLTSPSADGFCLEHQGGDVVRLSDVEFYVDGNRVYPSAPVNLTPGGIATVTGSGMGLKQGSRVSLVHASSKQTLATFTVAALSPIAGVCIRGAADTQPASPAPSFLTQAEFQDWLARRGLLASPSPTPTPTETVITRVLCQTGEVVSDVSQCPTPTPTPCLLDPNCYRGVTSGYNYPIVLPRSTPTPTLTPVPTLALPTPGPTLALAIIRCPTTTSILKNTAATLSGTYSIATPTSASLSGPASVSTRLTVSSGTYSIQLQSPPTLGTYTLTISGSGYTAYCTLKVTAA